MRRFALPLAFLLAAWAGFFAGRSWTRFATDAPVRSFEEVPIGGLATPATIDLPTLPDAPVRNLVLAVVDGLGIAELAAARIRAFGPDGRFVFERLPAVGLVVTHPAGRLVGKSDSSANALAAGVRTEIGKIGLADDGTPLETLLDRAVAAGLATGIVTTSEVYDATPAAFYAHVEKRRDYAAIVRQLAAAPLDLVAGGGVERFDGALLAAARERGVEVALTTVQLAAAARLPLWALFPGKRLGEKPAHPTLDEMTAKALDLLATEGERRGTGFFLLLEEEGTDTAGHANDVERLAAAALRFDAALARAARFAAADGRTLVVVVADHATGGAVIDDGDAPGTLRVTWTTGDHSGEPVALFAYGPESAQRALGGQLDQPELGRRLAALVGAGAR
ncbi:MAG TPA: alkaline phosphatase [Thermoanaerobaculia bacterium]